MAAAQLQGERNAREFIAKLPSATAEDREQLEQVKRQQAQVKKYDASLRQHMAKHQRMAANAPVERLNFNNQYVVPGSLSTLSQPPPQTILSSQPSNNPFTIPGTQQGEEASQYWANLYVQGEQQGGLTGIAKQAVAFPMGMLSSLWTKDTALQTSLTLGTSGLGALAGAGKLDAASMPVLRTMQIGGAFGSGTSIGQGISGKDMFTGEELSPLERGFNLTFGALGAGLDLGGSGLRLGNLSKSFPTVMNALEGISAPQITRTGGRLGLSTEGGSINLGGDGETPGIKGKVEPQVVKPKGETTVSKESTSETRQIKSESITSKVGAKSQYAAYVKYAKGYGKELGSYDAISNPGLLGPKPKDIEKIGINQAVQNSLASTFSGGRYTTIELDKPLMVYRVWSPGTRAREFGAYWSLEKPQGSLQSTIDSALKPEWGHLLDANGIQLPGRSQATKWVAIEVPAGTHINVGEVGAQGGTWVGGKSQVLIDRSLVITDDLVRARGDLK
jgi:hypothetical protein